MSKLASTITGLVLVLSVFSTACDDDEEITLISAIQGAKHRSPYADQKVTIRGVVTAVDSSASSFYMQSRAEDDDGDPNTSEGLFVAGIVRLHADDTLGVQEGDLVSVHGVIRESLARSSSLLPTNTQFDRASVTIESRGEPLPEPVVIGGSGRSIPTSFVDPSFEGVLGELVDETEGEESAAANFDPSAYAMDFYETVENMLVRVEEPLAVSPPIFGKIPVLANRGAGNTLSPRGTLIIADNEFHPQRLLLDDGFASSEPASSPGYLFSGSADGIATTDAFDYIVIVKEWPEGTDSSISRETSTLVGDATHLTVATYNVENLTATDSEDTFDAHADIIVNNLNNPDIIAVQEIGDNNGEEHGDPTAADQTFAKLIAAIQDAGGAIYEYRQIDPGPPVEDVNPDGGAPDVTIRVGFLFNPQRVTFEDIGTPDATTATTVTNQSGVPVLSLSPGRIDPENDAFKESRKPIVGKFMFNDEPIFVITAHLTSRRGDDPLFAAKRPPKLNSEEQRVAQAQIIKDFVDEITTVDADANVIVLGDMNTFQFSPEIAKMEEANLTDLVSRLPANEQYTYIFLGNAQVLDHILASDGLTANSEIDIVHVNADFPFFVRASDHDPVLARFAF